MGLTEGEMIIIWWTWCFPQTFIGFIRRRMMIGKIISEVFYMSGTQIVYYRGSYWDGASLGRYLFCPGEHMVRHEYGHSLQSLILGPLYLLVIGVPSMVWNFMKRRDMFSGIDYYAFFTERWADKLGKGAGG